MSSLALRNQLNHACQHGDFNNYFPNFLILEACMIISMPCYVVYMMGVIPSTTSLLTFRVLSFGVSGTIVALAGKSVADYFLL
jgi:hypothetical protein